MANSCTTVFTFTVSDWGKCSKKRSISLDEMGEHVPLNWIVKSFAECKHPIKSAEIEPRNEHSYDLVLEINEIDPEKLYDAVVDACTVGISFAGGHLRHNA